MKNQKGVSLITLIITIIVVIILAVIVLRSGASDAPDQANFSKFAQEMGELQDTVNLAMLTAKGEEQLKGNQRTEAQLYNFVARGGYEGFEAERKSITGTPPTTRFTDDEKWLTQHDAEERIVATQIVNKDIVEKIYNKKLDVEDFGIELPKRKVETAFGVGQEVLYFVTTGGNVFCWPPYVYDGKSYVNANTTVKSDTEVQGESTTQKGIVKEGTTEMGETEATAISEVIIAFENGEYVKIKNSYDSDNWIEMNVQKNAYVNTPSTRLHTTALEYGKDESVEIKNRGIIFRLYSNNATNAYREDGSTNPELPPVFD